MTECNGTDACGREWCQCDSIKTLQLENQRLASIIYSIVKRHPQVENWNLELRGVGEDILPDAVFVGWNTVGEDAILTVLHGESLENMRVAASMAREESDED